MSGHSKFANIKHKKEKNDAAKGKIFTKIGKEIAVAVKEGGSSDPSNNSRLRDVIAKAKSNNMPNDTIERNIKRASGDMSAANYEHITYEGYGPNGTAIIVETLTDNKNRTASNVKNAFTKGSGNVGTPGCVSFMFDKKGQIVIDKEEYEGDADELMMQVLDAGAEDFVEEEDSFEVLTDPDDFSAVRLAMEEAGIPVTEEQINLIAEKRVKEEINRGVQVIQYQVITLMTTNGQAPFITVFMYIDEVPEGQTREDLVAIIEEMLHQRIRGVKNEKGVWITPAFPKLIYVLEEDNIHEDSKYYYLTKLAAECSAKRLVPDYISEKVMKELKDGNCYPCMGCRSFLTVYHDENNKPKFYGRFNQGVVTINLVDVACSSGKDKDRFWKIFDERLELCHRALMCRHNRLKGTPSDVAPILWQYGALARLKKGETIDKLLYNGYSTISLGYAGLCECVKYMTGTSHTDPQATPFALEIMKHMNDACAKWKAEHNIDFSLYGTPLESTTYKFAKCLQKRFGLIPGITDKNYITNSYHVHVTEKINAFDKLKFESQFQKLSPGGAISYVEVPNMQNNIDAVLSVMKYIYENIMYAELNTKSDYCQVCGYNGEIQIVSDDDGKLVWECPNCGNRNQDKMNVARRTCGYIGTQFWNQGRTQEIKERVLHL